MKVKLHKRKKSIIHILGESFCVAFSLYSAIPMPNIKWTKQNMKYAFCFFPLIGVVIGFVMFLWLEVCKLLSQQIIFAAGAVTIPILLTGGIHMDGFCDTMDAIGSHGNVTRRLEIMRDSHSGAYAIIGCVLYVLIDFVFWMAFFNKPGMIFPIFIFSRALSGLAVANFHCAKGSGLAASFSDASAKKTVTITMCIYLLLSSIGMAFTPVSAFLCIIICVGLFLLYQEKSYKLFGGITGDLAGCFLVLCELAGLIAFIITQEFCV